MIVKKILPLSISALLLTGLAAVPAQATSAPAPSASQAQVRSAEEKALEQQLSADEPVAEGRVAISQGHIDLGPKFIDGVWTLMIHDDSAADPVWRRPADVVLVGSDAAKLPVPDDERYSFVGAKPGAEVFVIPQTEAPGVVWPGWNTQDPEVVGLLGKGVTLTLEKVQGPGRLTVYLENGNFSAPQVLWNSSRSERQDIWVEPNTHTHANWVFTEPGAYFVTVTVSADLADGRQVSHTADLQFAVGSGTEAEAVFAAAEARVPAAGQDGGAVVSASAAASSGVAASDVPVEEAGAERGSVLPWVLGGAGLVLALLVGVVVVGRKGSAAELAARERLK